MFGKTYSDIVSDIILISLSKCQSGVYCEYMHTIAYSTYIFYIYCRSSEREHTFTVCSCLKYKRFLLLALSQAEPEGLTNDIFGPYVGDAGFDPAGFVPWQDGQFR